MDRLSVGLDNLLECPKCGAIKIKLQRTVINKGFVFIAKCKNGHVFGLVISERYEGIELCLIDGRPEKVGSINYHAYILSDEWKEKADAAKERAGHKCQLCNTPGNNGFLHAHHRTYERLGEELPEDIIVLCADCHAKFHDKLN